ncbi:MAG TPA: glucose-6-phosphate dehydrogenase assembly protein OpcA [Ktedonobacterales bacterium]|nr:glucose-6-phosphate dehydrogenase assembly protein OpcA [Ktedonobacterales bacterium]
MSASTISDGFGGAQAPNDLTQTMRKVEPEAIETELDTSWREANASALASGGHAGARNTVMTLVIYANNRSEARRALAVLNDPGAQASRAIVILPSGATGDAPIEAYIATRSQTQEGGMTSYSEQIVLMAHDGAVQHLPGTLLPLIVAGLPSFFWWMGEPPWRTELLESLMDSSDRLIVDTAAMPQPERSLMALDDLMRRKKSSCAISDLNSARQAPWRELVASFFDTPEMLAYLGAIDQVSIEYAAGAEYTSEAPTNTAQAYLFAGWLASRLGWRALGGAGAARGGNGEHEQTLVNGVNQKITLQINARYGVTLKDRFDVSQVNIPIPTQDAPGAGADLTQSGAASVAAGALMLVRLRSTVNGQVGSFTVAREADLEHASTLAKLPLGSQPSKTVHLPTIGETALLTEQLHQLEHDDLYEDALAAAAQLLDPRTRRVTP